MSLLSKVKFAASEAFSKVFMFTGTVDNATDKVDITSEFYQWIIIHFLRRPGLIVAPDGSEFMVELTLTPASKEAKHKLLAEAQARLDEQNQVAGPEPTEGSKEWLDTLWARQLTGADRTFFERISQLRASGHRINYRTGNPTQYSVTIVAPPKPAKGKKVVQVGQPTPEVPQITGPLEGIERGDLVWNDDKSAPLWQSNPDGKFLGHFSPVFDLPSSERVPVVVLTVPEANSELFIVERSHWDSYVPGGSENWLEKSIQAFADDNGLSRDDITEVDFDQTRTREEMENMPDFQY